MSKLVEILGSEGRKGRSIYRLVDKFVARLVPSDLFVRSRLSLSIEMRTARQLYEMLKHGIILVDPDMQRRYVWDNLTASRFIESVIFHMPIPPIMLLVIGENKYYVIDGLQRLTTIYRFFEDELLLRGVTCLELEYRRYSKLPDKYRKILDYASTIPVMLIRIDADEPRYKMFLMYEIFRRVNLGVKPLTPRQVFYCTFLTPIVLHARKLALKHSYLFKESDLRSFRHCDFMLSMLETIHNDRISIHSVIQDITTLRFTIEISEKEAQSLADKASRLLEKWKTIGIKREHFTPAFYGLSNTNTISRLLVQTVTYITKPLIDMEVTPTIKEATYAALGLIRGDIEIDGKTLKEYYSMRTKKPNITLQAFRKIAEQARNIILKT